MMCSHSRVSILGRMLVFSSNFSSSYAVAWSIPSHPLLIRSIFLPSSQLPITHTGVWEITGCRRSLSRSQQPRLCPLHQSLIKRKDASSSHKLANSSHFDRSLRIAPLKGKVNVFHSQATQYQRGSQSSDSDSLISFDNTHFREYLTNVLRRYQEAQELIAGGDLTEKARRQWGRTLTDLAPVSTKIQEWMNLTGDMESIQQLYQEDEDKEMQDLASAEIEEYEKRLAGLQDEILKLLSPPQPTDDSDAIVEFTAGVGGQEAMLFTADLFAMYQRFAAYMKWRFEVLQFDTTDLGGLRQATASVSGHEAYKRFRYEAGVHRVQRIPKTEKAGRVHTSTMTVAVLPQPKQIDIRLESKDLRIETKKSSGPGGQSVNTTDSAVRITHLPTGFVAECQKERSQLKNRQIAMKLLQAKIYSQQLEQQTQNERSLRKQQVGTSGRSEKIRTYNYSQDRITDHRLAQSVHGVEEFLSGGQMLAEMTESLVQKDTDDALVYDVEEFIRSREEEQL